MAAQLIQFFFQSKKSKKKKKDRDRREVMMKGGGKETSWQAPSYASIGLAKLCPLTHPLTDRGEV